ncbi:MAG: MBL fold metallo-hydrolase [Lachnospiraceae bacterium]|nr:MBL fold metallo-hydrolase [Lachnospiraceae bacterium]
MSFDLSSVTLYGHSAVRIDGEHVVCVDPFHLKESPQDADIILVTHEHHDHFSPKDIEKAAAPDAVLVIPFSMIPAALAAGYPVSRLVAMQPGEDREVRGVRIRAVNAYNNSRPFHTKERGWLGFVIRLNGLDYYVAGDTDENEDNAKVVCDVAIVPVGGTYTMTADEAAHFVNRLHPKAAVPTHYGDIVGTQEDARRFLQLVDPAVTAEIRMKDD